MKITLKGGDVREYDRPMTVREIAFDISEGLGRNMLGAVSDGNILDQRTVIDKDMDLQIVTWDDEEGKSVYWHTSTHMMAQAVKRLYPTAKLAIGPTIKNGFYYDIEFEEPLSEDDLEKIEAEMKKISKEKFEITRFELPRNEALEFVKKENEDYKVEIINDLPEDSVISFYTQGEFTDLCRGPHVNNTKEIKAVKLMKVAGAYWRGDENNKMLTRIYGITFPKKKLLDEYLFKLEEAKKRDHRKLGRELGIFTMFEEGPGFPVFLNNGIVLRDILLDYWMKMHIRDNYVQISTPTMLSKELWLTSGHWLHYKENMYTSEIDKHEFAIKPMNCPGGILAYKQQMVSYRDLPMRVAELGHVHRHEMSGALHGLMRVRSFTQDDAHIYMLPEQIKDEIFGVMNMMEELYTLFGFTYHIELSTRPEDFMGDAADWDFAEEQLKLALEETGKEYIINEGDGAFYGPKIDFHLDDCLDRTWQCGTIQLDFQQPKNFDIDYIASDGTKKRPIMIHRVLFGSIERFIGILIEHYAGAFPTWLAPVQAAVLSISEDFNDYAKEVTDKMLLEGLRVKSDLRNERIGYKIREWAIQKLPYQIIVGKEEMENNTISVRPRGEVKNVTYTLDEFIEKVKAESTVEIRR